MEVVAFGKFARLWEENMYLYALVEMTAFDYTDLLFQDNFWLLCFLEKGIVFMLTVRYVEKAAFQNARNYVGKLHALRNYFVFRFISLILVCI